MITTAFIKIWGAQVGAVAWDERQQLATFEYDPNFLKHQQDLAPLKMPLSANQRIFSFPMLRNNATFKGLPGLLADVLPDRYGNQLINAWLVQSGRLENSMNPVEMLCFIGTRGLGALEFEPAYMKPLKRPFDLEIDSLVNITSQMLKKREAFETNLKGSETEAMLDILKVGTSAGGARPKAIITFNEKTGQVKSGQTDAPKGFGHWLIKLDGVSDAQFGETSGYGRVEMAYYLMAKACGIEMMESRLLEEHDRAHFMTKRFDRSGSDQKHHIQTWCAMQHYDYNDVFSYSYEQLFQTMRQLKLTYPQAEQLFRRMVFNVYSRNCDDHTKNFAFRLKRDGVWELAPAYDVCHAYRPGSEWVSQQSLSINGKRTKFTESDFQIVARSMNIKKAASIIKEIKEKVNNWHQYAEETKIGMPLRDAIWETLEEVLR